MSAIGGFVEGLANGAGMAKQHAVPGLLDVWGARPRRTLDPILPNVPGHTAPFPMIGANTSARADLGPAPAAPAPPSPAAPPPPAPPRPATAPPARPAPPMRTLAPAAAVIDPRAQQATGAALTAQNNTATTAALAPETSTWGTLRNILASLRTEKGA